MLVMLRDIAGRFTESIHHFSYWHDTQKNERKNKWTHVQYIKARSQQHTFKVVLSEFKFTENTCKCKCIGYYQR